MMTRSATLKCLSKCSSSAGIEDEIQQKCKERKEYYESRKLENSKDSLDLIYERKRGLGKSCSADFTVPKREKPVKRPFDEFPRKNGLPRSASDLPTTRRRGCSESGHVNGVILEIQPHQLTRTQVFRNNRSRSATIPRKWSEYRLPTDEADDLPDGSCFRRTIHGPNVRRNLNRETAAIRNAEVWILKHWSDCLHLQLYRDSRDRYKQGQTKASLSLQQFLGVETGFTLDKESNTIAIVCQDVTVVLAFDTRERLIQWQVKISCNLGDGHQFLVLVSQAPSKAKIPTGPARLHVQEYRFCMTSGVPPKLIGCWDIAHLRRYGVVEGRFCFEGGSRCMKGEGLYVLVTDQGQDITKTLQMAAQGKLASKRRPMVRKSSIVDSPRKMLQPRSEFLNDSQAEDHERSSSPYWSMESRRTEMDCGDATSVHGTTDLPTSLERCVSCISKLGAPSMSRSSTANTTQLFSPAWTMEQPQCGHQWEQTNGQNQMWSDRISLSSHGTGSSGASEYSVPRQVCTEPVQPPLPPKSTPVVCSCPHCPPTRPPKPTNGVGSPSRKKPKKPPMPLPEEECQPAGSYENYDVPRNYVCETGEYYDTPKSLKENLSSNDAAGYGNYDTPPAAKTIRKPCGCVVTFARQAVVEPEPRSECPCQRVMCWAENWMMLPYCRRGHGIDNSVGIHKVKLSGQGKMPVVNACGELAIYATVDKAKKTKKSEPLQDSNYVNVDAPTECPDGTNYENIDFAQSLEYYENAKDLIQRAGLGKETEQNKPEEVSFTVNNGVKVCNKCGHCQSGGEPRQEPKQEDYLMMEPGQATQPAPPQKKTPHGYLPMFPGNKSDLAKMLANRGLPVEKSASVSSLPGCGRGRETRIPGSAMMVMPNIRRLKDTEDARRNITSRKRSSSADSSRYLEELEDFDTRTSSPSSPVRSVEKPTSNSLTSLPYQSPKRMVPEPEEKPPALPLEPEEEVCDRTIVEDTYDCNSSSGSLQTLVHEAATSPGVHIRRSSSVPCKSGNNRDSSSSNDSGVSTGSLKQRGRDFAEFELPLTTAQSARRHQSAQRHPGDMTCLHASLPRRSKSSDPLRELTFQFQMTRIPAKSSSAEAEVPVCPNKKGYFSPNDGTAVPYMDSRSTSSGTSDMSDYIETLSLSSHSSSDAQDTAHRISRIAVTTLRPRSGNEYHKIDRSNISTDMVVKQGTQLGHYANIPPLIEKSESPSPGYMSGSPARELPCDDY